MPATTFSQEVLRALALGSFPQSDAEKRKSVALLRVALRCRKERYLSAAQLAKNASPVVMSKLAPYLHDILGDVTKKQSRVIAQAIKRGIDRKWADSTVARTIAKFADIEPDRAKVIARTEMARAKADIQLGKKRDSAKVVFTLGNEDACPICEALDGKVFTVRKAAGVIPVHPACRCFWSDAAKGAKVTRNEIAPITNDFRDSLLRFSALNQFCATGEGGGVDPSCGSSEGKRGGRLDRVTGSTEPISTESARSMVDGKTEKPTGVNPAIHFQGEGNWEHRIGRIDLDDIAPNEEGDLFDTTTKRGLVEEYSKRSGVDAPPVVLTYSHRSGNLNVIDGGHRISAARMRGDKSIIAIVSIKRAKPN